jgi:putative peptidoglycan lipid II flippase
MYSKPQSFLRSLFSSVIWKSLGVFLSFFKHVVIASTFGLGLQTDLFYMTSSLVGILVGSWAAVIEISIIPTLVQEKSKANLCYQKDFASIFMIVALFSLIITIVVYFGRYRISHLLAGLNEEKIVILAHCIFYYIPIILLTLPMATINSFLRAHRDFSAINHSMFIIAFLTLLIFILYHAQPYVLIWSYNISFVIGFFYLFWQFRKYQIAYTKQISTAIFKKYFYKTPGVFILQSFSYINGFADRIFASYLTEGCLSALSYAFTIVMTFPAVLNISLGLFTVTAEQKNINDAWKQIEKIIALATYYSVAIITFLYFARIPLVEFLLKRGMFSASNCKMVADALIYFSPCLLATIIIGAIDCFLVVQDRIYLIVARTIMATLCNITLNYTFIFIFDLGLLGIALATSISSWLLVVISIFSLKKINIKVSLYKMVAWLLWVLCFCVVGCLIFNQYLLLISNNFFTICLYASIVAIFAIIAGILYLGEEGQLVKKNIMRILIVAKIIKTKVL